MNANSPIIEQIIFFHDYSLIFLIFIIVIIRYIIFNIVINTFYNRFLLENHDIEVIWTIIPALILIFIAVPRLRLLYLIEESFEVIINVKIIGHQWYWSYEYTDFNIEYDSFILRERDLEKRSFRLLDTDNNIILPYKTGVRLLVRSADVIHSWTVPSLALKVDAIPGRLNQLILYGYRPGLYYGQCSEICGANHSFIPICLEIVSLKNFIQWVNKFSLNGWSLKQ